MWCFPLVLCIILHVDANQPNVRSARSSTVGSSDVYEDIDITLDDPNMIDRLNEIGVVLTTDTVDVRSATHKSTDPSKPLLDTTGGHPGERKNIFSRRIIVMITVVSLVAILVTLGCLLWKHVL